MSRQPAPVRLDVLRAKQRPADLTFSVQLWRLPDGRWWHDPYAIVSTTGQPDPAALRVLGHAVSSDGWDVWVSAGSPLPPSRKKVKARRGRR